VFYSQQHILELLVQQSSLGLTSSSDNDNSLSTHNMQNERTESSGLLSNSLPIVLDSDEGSISSGCETASTVTTNLEDTSKSTMEAEQNSLDSNSAPSEVSVETTVTRVMRNKISSNRIESNDDSDSEYSDESGYVEYQEKMGCRSKSILI